MSRRRREHVGVIEGVGRECPTGAGDRLIRELLGQHRARDMVRAVGLVGVWSRGGLALMAKQNPTVRPPVELLESHAVPEAPISFFSDRAFFSKDVVVGPVKEDVRRGGLLVPVYRIDTKPLLGALIPIVRSRSAIAADCLIVVVTLVSRKCFARSVSLPTITGPCVFDCGDEAHGHAAEQSGLPLEPMPDDGNRITKQIGIDGVFFVLGLVLK